MKDGATIAREKWTKVKEQVIAEYPHVTHEDLECEIGEEITKLEQLREKLGETREKIFYWLHLMG